MSVQTSTHRQRPPLLLGERYVIVRRVGRGGAANVYLAFDLEGKRWRAMKVMHPKLTSDRDMRTRFFREARLMASIDHRHVVRVTDVGEGAVPYMVMEYIRGGCVLDWLRAHGAMPPQLAAQVARDVAVGLAATHEVDVVHRDVKPHNILVHVDGSCKLTDYGIAKLVGDSMASDGEDLALTRVGTAMGTVAFMPPEQQHNAAAVDARADLYSLGATLFTLLKSKAPQDLYVADVADEQFEGLPADLVEIVVRACRYKPEDRYQSAAEMVDALEAALDELGTMPEGTPSLIAIGDELPGGPPATVEREHVEELLELVATGLAVAYDASAYGTMSSEADGGESDGAVEAKTLTVDDYSLTPMPADRPASEESDDSRTMDPVPPEEEESDRMPWVVGGVLAALAVGIVGGFVALGLLSSGTIAGATKHRDEAARALIAGVDQADSVVDALSEKGDRKRLGAAEALFDGSGSELEQLAHAISLTELVETQHVAVSQRFGDDLELREQVEGLTALLRRYERSQEELQAEHLTVGGAVARRMGLAQPLEPFGSQGGAR